MWLLKDNNGTLIYIKPKRTCTVGRKNTTLVLTDDSVSRNHAEIRIVPKSDISEITDNMEPLSYCMIKDSGSKYGTYILKDSDKDVQLSKKEETLKHLDKIRFGVQSVFTVMYVPIITATSGLDDAEKEQLDKITKAIDGIITVSWEKLCTHMTVSNPNISEKFTCALAYGTPVVPTIYWNHVLKAFKANEPIPEPDEFAKLINDKLRMLGNISVTPNPLRKTLFKGLTFLHFDSHQYNLYSRMIELSGGKPILYRNRSRDIDVCADNIVVVQLVESNTTQATGTGDANYAEASEKLGKCRRRTIPTSEIAIAIFHCSTEKNCNPKYDHVGMFKRKTNVHKEKANVLALDTQDVDASYSITKKPTNAAGKSSNSENYIKESTEQDSAMDSSPIEIVCTKPSEFLPGNNAKNRLIALKNSSQRGNPETQSQSDNGSIKVATLNYGRNLYNESDVNEDITEKPSKRIREDDDVIIDGIKKIRCEAPIEDKKQTQEKNNKKRNFTTESSVSYDDIEFDEEIALIHQHGSQNKDSSEINKQKSFDTEKQSGNDEISHKEPIFVDLDSEDFSESTNSKLRNTEKGEASGKRKAGRAGILPLTDIRSPLKRTKIATNVEKKSSKLYVKPSNAQTSIMNFFSPTKNSNDQSGWTETERKSSVRSFFPPRTNPKDESEWMGKGKSRKRERDSSDVSPSRVNVSADTERMPGKSFDGERKYFPKNSYNPNISLQSLLRVKCPSELTTLAVPQFGKTFHKVYTKIPLRIAMMSVNDTLDSIVMCEGKEVPNKSTKWDEEASTSRKDSSKSVSGSKKTFRL